MNDPAGQVSIESIKIGGNEFKFDGPWQLQLAFLLGILALFLWSMIWIIRDAGRRGRSGCLALIFLLAASWPLSILWWLWLRPPLVDSDRPARCLPPSLP